MRGPGTAPMRILLNSRCVRWSGPRATSAQFLLKINIRAEDRPLVAVRHAGRAVRGTPSLLVISLAIDPASRPIGSYMSAASSSNLGRGREPTAPSAASLADLALRSSSFPRIRFVAISDSRAASATATYGELLRLPNFPDAIPHARPPCFAAKGEVPRPQGNVAEGPLSTITGTENQSQVL